LDMVLGCFVRLAEAEMPFSNSMTSSMLESQCDGPDSLSIVNGSASPRSSTPQGEETLTKENFSNPHAARIPLAKLLPALRSAINDRKKPDEQLVLVRHLLCLDVLNCFAANIYEAFCEPNNSQNTSPDQPSTSKAPYQNGHAPKMHWALICYLVNVGLMCMWVRSMVYSTRAAVACNQAKTWLTTNNLSRDTAFWFALPFW